MPRPTERAHRSFIALLEACGRSAEAAQAVSAAYEAMTTAERRDLLDAVLEDSQRLGTRAAPALALLLSIETEAELAARLHRGLAAFPPTALTASPPQAWLQEGAAILSLALYGPFVALWALEWDQEGLQRTHHDPLTTVEEALAFVSSFGDAQPVSEQRARQEMVRALWRHRTTHGCYPAGADAFAALL